MISPNFEKVSANLRCFLFASCQYRKKGAFSMGVLILSCSTGAGHDSCAKAIKQVYDTHGIPCDIYDSLRFTSESFSALMSKGHVAVYRYTPTLFRLGYDFSERHPSMLDEHSGLYHLLAMGAKRLHQLLLEKQYDTVLCTHVFAAMLLTDMLKSRPLPIKTGFVATDFTCYPGVPACKVDRYFIPSERLTEAYAATGIPKEAIVASGIPIRQMLYDHAPKAAAKAHFSIAENHAHLVMMCGSMGCGPIKELTQLLSRHLSSEEELTVVCGTNRRLLRSLQQKYATRSNIHILGYVTEMGLLMDSADLYLTKPGGLSVSEAAAKNLPMVLIDAVAGCEEHNRRFFVELGGAVTAPDTESLALICGRLLKDTAHRQYMQQALAALDKKNAGECIFATMSSL